MYLVFAKSLFLSNSQRVPRPLSSMRARMSKYDDSHFSSADLASPISLIADVEFSRKIDRTLISPDTLVAISHAIRPINGSIRWSSL